MMTPKQLWTVLKADWVASTQPVKAVTQQTHYDAERKIYVVGDVPTTWQPGSEKVMIERYTQTSPEDTIPEGFHKCFHYDTLQDAVTGQTSFKRCQVHIKPVDNYCWSHRHDVFKTNRTCKLCSTRLFTQSDYCEYHSRGTSSTDSTHWAFEDGELIPHPEDELAQSAPAAAVNEADCGCGGFCIEHAKPDPEFDAIVENITWTYVNQVGWGKLKPRQARKQYTMENVHFRIECRGSRDSVDLFHAILALCDNDYPLDPFRKNSAPPKECPDCKGHIWMRAVLMPADLKKAAKQAGIRIKVRDYITDTACAKKAKAAKA